MEKDPTERNCRSRNEDCTVVLFQLYTANDGETLTLPRLASTGPNLRRGFSIRARYIIIVTRLCVVYHALSLSAPKKNVGLTEVCHCRNYDRLIPDPMRCRRCERIKLRFKFVYHEARTLIPVLWPLGTYFTVSIVSSVSNHF